MSDLGTLGGTASRALRVSTPFSGEIFGESRTVDGDLHPVRWWAGHIADFTQALGANSQIELVVPVRGDLTTSMRVISGTASPGAPVHAYLVSVPFFTDPSTPRAIVDGVIEDVVGSGELTRFVFTTNDVTASIITDTAFRKCQPCAAGDTVSLDQNQLGSDVSSGTATVLGNQYAAFETPQIVYTISAGSFIVPTTGEQSFTVSMPFSYSGFVLGALRGGVDWRRPDSLFGVSLSGTGTVTFEIFSPDGRIYFETKLQYVFEAPSASVYPGLKSLRRLQFH
jgi:hypothetical protein